MIMKLNYERPSISVIDCEVELPVAYSVQPGGEGEDDVILGARQRNMWNSDSKNSLWVINEECAVEEEGFHW